jgi:hypothetical protein
MYFPVVIIGTHCYSSQSTIYSSFIYLFLKINHFILRPNVQYLNYFFLHICKTCEFYYFPLHSFACQHEIVTEDLKILNIKILEIHKMVVILLGNWQKSIFNDSDICMTELDFYKLFQKSKYVNLILYKSIVNFWFQRFKIQFHCNFWRAS